MKKILLLLLAGITCLSAAPVAQSVAETAARHYYLKNSKSGSATISRVVVNSRQNRVSAYTFVFQDGSFVITAADDRCRPILGYSDEPASFSQEMPPALQWWLNSFAEQLAFAEEKKLQTSEFSAEWKSLLDPAYVQNSATKSSFYLVKSKWNQRPLYNNSCPSDSGRLSVVGCVATASAQLMKFWNYPERGTGIHTYNCNTTFPKVTLTNNYDSLINWKIIPHKLSDDMSPEVIKETAKLCSKVGIALNMSYSATGSGTQASYIAEMLKSHYKYSNSVQSVERRHYTESAWLELLKSEINAGRPMEYSGMELFSGHSFICDGYNGDDLFHFNWGWGGSYDGYFAVNALNVATYSFNYSQGAVIGIQPPVANGLSCTIAQPAAGSIFDQEQNVAISAAVSVNSGSVSKVEFYLDNQLIATDDSFPYSLNLTTTGLPLGGHTVRAAAYASDGYIKDYTVGFYLKNAADQILANADFDSGEIPDGWSRKIKNSSGYWNFSNFSMNDYVHINPSSSSSAMCKGTNYTTDEYLVTPQLDLTAQNRARVDFAVLFSRKALNSCSLFVKVSENYTAATPRWTKIWSAQTDNDTASAWLWRNRSLDLSSYAGKKIWLSWNYKGSKGDGVAVDDIFVVNNLNSAGLPVITVENPIDNQLVLKGDLLQIKANAADNGSVTNMVFYLNNTKLYECDGAALTYNWLTADLLCANYRLKVTATDNQNQIAAKEFNIKLTDGSPLLQLGSPVNGDKIDKEQKLNFQVSALSAFANTSISSVKFFIDNQELGSGIKAGNYYNFSYPAVTFAAGEHTVRVVALNEIGQSSVDSARIIIYNRIYAESFTDSIPAGWSNYVNLNGHPAGEPGQVWKFKNNPSTLNPSGLKDSDFMWIYSYNYGTAFIQNTTAATKGITIPAGIDTLEISLDECFERRIGGGSSARIRFSTDSINWQTLRIDSLNNVCGETYRSMKRNTFSIKAADLAGKSKVYLSFTYIGTSFCFWIVDNIEIIGWKRPESGSPSTVSALPESSELQTFNYPNPFNNTTAISYQLPVEDHVKLTVYNSRGEEVAELVNGPQRAGRYQISFNGANLSSGIYFYRLQTPTAGITSRMLLLK